MDSKLKMILTGTLLVAAIGLVAFVTSCSRQPAASSEKTLYTCGMHPWIIQDHPGNCPICGMKLEPVASKLPAFPATQRLTPTKSSITSPR